MARARAPSAEGAQLNGTEWFVWYENGVRHAIVFPWWGYGLTIGVAVFVFAWRRL